MSCHAADSESFVETALCYPIMQVQNTKDSEGKMNKKAMHTLIQRIAVGVSCLAVLLTAICPLTASAAEPQTIRVGYFAFPGYHEVLESENGPQGSGYGFDFLQMLRRYTNLNYQYVGYEDSWQDMQQMLRDGQIDMVTFAR